MATAGHGKMLGNADTVILGLLLDEPRHAYDIVRTYHARSMDKWVDVGDATIYQAMPRLERGGLIEPVAGKGEGKKKVYKLTSLGKKRLRQELLARLASEEVYDLDMNVAIGFIEHLKREEAVAALSERRRRVLEVVRDMGKLPYASEDGSRSLPHDMIALQRFRLAEAELQWLDQVMKWLA